MLLKKFNKRKGKKVLKKTMKFMHTYFDYAMS